MARRQSVKLVFGERSFDLRPLSLNQVEMLEEVVAESSLFGGKERDGEAPMRAIQAAKRIIGIGLSRDHADVDVDDLDGDIQTFVAAQAAILRQGGFMPEKPGEALAAAGNAPIGELSEAG